MKFNLCVLASLLATASAQLAISQPKAGTVLTRGQNFTVQIQVPFGTSPNAGTWEISLAIGIVGCGTAACPAASADLGEHLFLGTYVSQGQAPDTAMKSFENFTVTVPDDISGKASIQVQHNYLTTPPGHAFPTVEYTSLPVQVGSSPVPGINVHPNTDNTKCVGILGGNYANGAAVDIYDCNGSNTQRWRFNGNSLQSTNPADNSTWCLDSGVQSTWTDGLKMKIWQCLPNLPQQTWTPLTQNSVGAIKLTTANFCLDLTNGIKTNQNVLQVWTCGSGNTNQLWSVTAA